MEQVGAENRDSILDIMFAMMVVDNSAEERYLKLDEVKTLVDKLSETGKTKPELHEYDMPDLSVDSILKNKHVDYVSLDNEIAFRMEEDEAKQIIDRNNDVVRIIFALDYALDLKKQIQGFDEDCKKLSNGRVSFVYGDPNLQYLLGSYNNGDEINDDKLLTDGVVTVIEEDSGSKMVSVKGATYSIHASFVRERLDEAEVITNIMNPVFLAYLIFDVRDFCKNQYGAYEQQSSKPYIYKKRKN